MLSKAFLPLVQESWCPLKILVMNMNSIDLVVKVSERCNFACKYCYFFEQNYNPYYQSAAQMSLKVMDATSDFIANTANPSEFDRLNVGLHGGEPLLIKKEKMKYFLETIRRKTNNLDKININIQTNAALLDQEWLDIFRNFRVSVGVSIDGPKKVNNESRIYPNGRGTFDDIMRGIKLVQKSELKNNFGVLCVANPNYSGREIIKFFVEDLNLYSFNILLPRIGYDEKNNVNINVWNNYFEEILKYWLLEIGPSKVNIGFLSGFLFSLISAKGSENFQKIKKL